MSQHKTKARQAANLTGQNQTARGAIIHLKNSTPLLLHDTKILPACQEPDTTDKPKAAELLPQAIPGALCAPQAQLGADSWAFLAYTCANFRENEIQRIQADIDKQHDDYLFCLGAGSWGLAHELYKSLVGARRLLAALNRIGEEVRQCQQN